ncbi:protein Ycf2-like [Eucalyptus grandis]|uniref:protein Ycf2-like n=1 Tax=Eucalyptus grandis TaxID=71139 RepID=UPI00192F0F88|nr:protein Ycf2-like [Eucalyptus grandis]
MEDLEEEEPEEEELEEESKDDLDDDPEPRTPAKRTSRAITWGRVSTRIGTQGRDRTQVQASASGVAPPPVGVGVEGPVDSKIKGIMRVLEVMGNIMDQQFFDGRREGPVPEEDVPQFVIEEAFGEVTADPKDGAVEDAKDLVLRSEPESPVYSIEDSIECEVEEEAIKQEEEPEEDQGMEDPEEEEREEEELEEESEDDLDDDPEYDPDED